LGKDFTCWNNIIDSGGVAAQFKETSDEQASQAASAAQTLQIVRGTSTTVKGISQILTSLDDAELHLTLVIPCEDKIFADACKIWKKGDNDSFFSSPDNPAGPWGLWPRDAQGVMISAMFEISFFVDAKDATRFLAGDTSAADLRYFVVGLNATEFGGNEGRTSAQFHHWADSQDVILTVTSTKAPVGDNNAKISGLVDLKGATVVISQIKGLAAEIRFLPREIGISIKNGQSLGAGEENRLSETKRQGWDGPVYIGVMSTRIGSK